jgi:hypothetical protein
MITHFAHMAGHQNIAKTTTAAANKNRQKQSFMISPPYSSRLANLTANYDSMARAGYEKLELSGALADVAATDSSGLLFP